MPIHFGVSERPPGILRSKIQYGTYYPARVFFGAFLFKLTSCIRGQPLPSMLCSDVVMSDIDDMYGWIILAAGRTWLHVQLTINITVSLLPKQRDTGAYPSSESKKEKSNMPMCDLKDLSPSILISTRMTALPPPLAPFSCGVEDTCPMCLLIAPHGQPPLQQWHV